MTMPNLMNCAHQGEGWCLDCVNKLTQELASTKEKLDQAKELAEKVVRKVESGKMHSVNTYKDCKDFLASLLL